jgi:hypothetical protein
MDNYPKVHQTVCISCMHTVGGGPAIGGGRIHSAWRGSHALGVNAS